MGPFRIKKENRTLSKCGLQGRPQAQVLAARTSLSLGGSPGVAQDEQCSRGHDPWALGACVPMRSTQRQKLFTSAEDSWFLSFSPFQLRMGAQICNSARQGNVLSRAGFSPVGWRVRVHGGLSERDSGGWEGCSGGR